MSEEITVEEASLCPKCNQQGQLNAPKGAKVYQDRKLWEGEWWDGVVYYCYNRGCNWFETGWVVYSNTRGVVYQRDQGPRGQDKQFPAMSPDALAQGRRMVEDASGKNTEET